MKALRCLAILVSLVLAASLQAQDGEEGYADMAAETDSIDAVYVEGIYYYQPKAEYLVLYEHRFYVGPSFGPPDERVKSDYYVKALSKDGKTVGSAYGADWLRGGPKGLERLKAAEYYHRVFRGDGGGSDYMLGSKSLDDSLCGNLWDAEECLQGQKGDLLFIIANSIVNGSWGYVDHTQQSVEFFRPPSAFNFYELNSSGYDAYEKKDWKEAIRLFKESLEINPKNKYALFNLACTLCLSGRPFSEGRPYLDVIWALGAEAASHRAKMAADADLAAWRKEAAWKEWMAGKK